MQVAHQDLLCSSIPKLLYLLLLFCSPIQSCYICPNSGSCCLKVIQLHTILSNLPFGWTILRLCQDGLLSCSNSFNKLSFAWSTGFSGDLCGRHMEFCHLFDSHEGSCALSGYQFLPQPLLTWFIFSFFQLKSFSPPRQPCCTELTTVTPGLFFRCESPLVSRKHLSLDNLKCAKQTLGGSLQCSQNNKDVWSSLIS